MYAGFNFQASKEVKFIAHGSYSKSEASFGEVKMPVNDPAFQEASAGIAEANYEYDHMNTYSDMSFDYMNLGATMKYKISDKLTFKVGLDYHSLTDDKTYVYGDESGSYFVITTGFKYGL